MFEPKVPALFAAAGFVLSFIIGLVSGVPLSLVLIRAILLAVFFAVLSVGVLFLIKKFLPELLDFSSSDVSSLDTNQGAVDITIDDPSSDILSTGSDIEGFNAEMMPDFVTSREKSQKSDILSGDNESNIEKPDLSESDSNESRNNGAIVRNEFIPGLPVSSVLSTEVKNKPGHSVDGLDVLPDLDDFVSPDTSTKDTPVEESASFESSPRAGSFMFSDSESGSSSNEAATMAKAIRTILAREK